MSKNKTKGAINQNLSNEEMLSKLKKLETTQNTLTNMNPVAQAQLLKQNLSELQNNSSNILNTLTKLLDKVSISSTPCEFSKFFTDQVCSLHEKTKNLTDEYKVSNLKNKVDEFKKIIKFDEISSLANDSIEITKELLKNDKDENQNKSDFWQDTSDNENKDNENKDNENKDKNKKINKQKAGSGLINLYKNINKISNIIYGNFQKGGSINNKYKYIINPKDNKKVNINSKKGQHILKMYMKELL